MGGLRVLRPHPLVQENVRILFCQPDTPQRTPGERSYLGTEARCRVCGIQSAGRQKQSDPGSGCWSAALWPRQGQRLLGGPVPQQYQQPFPETRPTAPFFSTPDDLLSCLPPLIKPFVLTQSGLQQTLVSVTINPGRSAQHIFLSLFHTQVLEQKETRDTQNIPL